MKTGKFRLLTSPAEEETLSSTGAQSLFDTEAPE
jgi:hypothetical protein